MIEKVIIAHLYNSGSAATNRIIAYAKSFVSLSKEVVMVLGCDTVMPLPELDGVKVKSVKALSHFLLVSKMAGVVKKYYTKESAILVYGSPLLCLFLPKNMYNIFYECTEIPFYGRRKTLATRIKEAVKIFLDKRATGMLVISNALAEYFGILGVKNIAVVNMFVDVERFSGVQTEGENEKYIAYCGTISPFKDGVDCLIKAFSLFYKTHSDYNLKLIGKFESKSAEQKLRGLVNELKLSDIVSFTGVVSPSEMPALLCGARILALARPDNEQAKYGFPTKLGEYLATGRPVVVTNVGEIGCFLKDGENCRIARPGDESDFAEKMIWVANNYDAALRLGNRGKKLTLSEFSCKEQAKKALYFMESVIKKS